MTLPIQSLKKRLVIHNYGRLSPCLKSPSVSLLLRTTAQTRWLVASRSALYSTTSDSKLFNTGMIASVRYHWQQIRYQNQPTVPRTDLATTLAPAVASLNTSIRFFASSSSAPTTTTALQYPPSNLNIQLYQYRICPFCNRVKTVLDYIHNSSQRTTTRESDNTTLLSVQNIEVNPISKTEIKQFSKEYRKVPIATFQYISSLTPSDTSQPTTTTSKTIFGSDEIIHHLLTEYPMIRTQLEQHWTQQHEQQPQSSSTTPIMTYDTFVNHDTAKVWTAYATNELAVWLYPNMCRSYGDSFTAFQYIHEPTLPFSTFQRYMIQYIGALAMTFAANKIKSTFLRLASSSYFHFHTNNDTLESLTFTISNAERHNVTDERRALEDVLIKLDTELYRLNPKASTSANYLFLSGTTTPNIGDLNVYGVLRAIQNLPIYQEMILSKRTSTNEEEMGESPIVQWLHHMSKHILH